MDAEKFFEQLRDKVNQVRVDVRVAHETQPNTVENLKAAMSCRRDRDALTSLIARRPEEFAGLVVALAAQVHGLSERVAKLEGDRGAA